MDGLEQTQELVSQDLQDNSDAQTVEPSIEDNSNTDTANEPEQNIDNTDKQKTQTGFTDLETANKSYQELQKKLGEQGQELGSLRKQSEELTQLKEFQNKFLNNLGFNSIEEFENAQRENQFNEELSKFEINQYLEQINSAEFPDEVKRLITLYHSSTNSEDKRQVLDSIEANFSTDIIKKIAANVALYKGQLDNQKAQALQEQQFNAARSYLQNAVQKYPDEFKNQDFATLYGEAFKSLGPDLNTDYFMQLCQNLKKSWIDEALKAHNIQTENENTKDRITDGINNRPTSDTKNILDMSEAEIRDELRKYK